MKRVTAKTPEELGFSDVDTDVVQRLVMSIEGHNKTGKTNLALSAPAPIVVFDLDIGLEGVARKHSRKDHRILHKQYRLAADLEATTEQDQARAEAVWSEFKRDFSAVCKMKEIRTIVWDSATEVWELARLAEFGKLTQIQPWHYTALNAEFRKVLRLAIDTDKNFILTHKLTEVYEEFVNSQGKKQGRPTGEYRRAGFKDMPYVVQVNLRTFRKGGKFGAEILDCRQDGELGGMPLKATEANFPHIATMVFPETDLKDWR